MKFLRIVLDSLGRLLAQDPAKTNCALVPKDGGSGTVVARCEGTCGPYFDKDDNPVAVSCEHLTKVKLDKGKLIAEWSECRCVVGECKMKPGAPAILSCEKCTITTVYTAKKDAPERKSKSVVCTLVIDHLAGGQVKCKCVVQ